MPGTEVPENTRLLIHSAQHELSGRAYRIVAEGGFAYEMYDGSPSAAMTGPAPVDVIHVPSGTALDVDRARAMLARPAAVRFGILSEDAGLILHEVGRTALEFYYRQFTKQADTAVYKAGGADRQRLGSHSRLQMPRQVYLGLTQRCNRSCRFCVSRSFAFDLLSFETIEELCAQLAGAVQVIALTGAGEAMMHPRFWDVLDLLRRRLPDVQFKMNTSGLGLIKNAPRLLQYPIRNITVSLNAATAPTYERFVGPGFDAVLRGIRSLADARAAAGRDDLHVCLSMVLMRSTVEETEPLADIAARLGVEEIQGIYLMINDDTLAGESLWHDPDHANAVLAAARTHAAALGVRASLPPAFRVGEMYRGRDQLSSLPVTQGQRCTEAWSTVYVRPDGDVIACPYMDRAMGNVREQKLDEVWNGAQYQELRRGLVEQDLCGECRHCCGFNEAGSVDEYRSHWLGVRQPGSVKALPLISV